MIKQLLSRRKFNRFCAALGSSLSAVIIKTADALGVSVPPALLLQADKVIE